MELTSWPCCVKNGIGGNPEEAKSVGATEWWTLPRGDSTVLECRLVVRR